MPARRIPIVKVRRLATLLANVHSPSRVSKDLGISRSTVAEYRKQIQSSGYSFKNFGELDAEQIAAILRQKVKKKRIPTRYTELWAILPEVFSQVASGKSNLRKCWTDYRRIHTQTYGYTQFAAYFRRWRIANKHLDNDIARWRILHISSDDAMQLAKWRRSNNRREWAKSVAILDLSQGLPITRLCSKLEKSSRVIKRWRNTYVENGIDGLRSREPRKQNQDKLEAIAIRRTRLVELLHESPQIHSINRAAWSLKTLARAYEAQHGEPISISTVSEYIIADGYSFKKARRVLTSPDPEYREKLQQITQILENLGENEKFFSVDEFGPCSVKMRGGRSFMAHNEFRVVPQRQRSKGSLIVTGALELSTNQMTHFYSERKNTGEILRLLDLLLEQYSNQSCLYLSWDAASWHASTELAERILEINTAAITKKSPIVKLAPLPSSAQFLNVIESVYSGMAKAVIHNSDYSSVEECKNAIDIYLADRNEYYKQNPKRAGNKIWGNELVSPNFKPSNNCKDPNWR